MSDVFPDGFFGFAVSSTACWCYACYALRGRFDARFCRTMKGGCYMADLADILEWTFISECSIPGDVAGILVPGEEPYAAYKTIRDSAIFTNRRLIVRDAQGITGKKVEIYSIPWKSVTMWSSENAGHLDANAEIEVWMHGKHAKINLKRGVDIRKLDSLIAACVL